MKKQIISLMAICLCVTMLGGCNNTHNESSYDSVQDAFEYDDFEGDDENQTLFESLDGYWHRIDDDTSGISMLNFFYLDSSAGTWSAYDSAGFEVNGHNGSIWEEDGVIFMDFALTGEIVQFEVLDDDGRLILADDTGEITFEYGEKPAIESGDGSEPISYATWAGKWFLNGIKEDDDYYRYYVFDEYGNYETHVFSYGEDEVSSEGEYSWGTVNTQINGGSSIEQLTINLGDPMDFNYYVVTDNKIALIVEDGLRYSCYLRENMIGTDEGEKTLSLMQLYGDWSGNTKETIFPSYALNLLMDGTFSRSLTLDYDVPPKEVFQGTWEQSEEGVTLYYEDGSIEEAVLSEDRSELYLTVCDFVLLPR